MNLINDNNQRRKLMLEAAKLIDYTLTGTLKIILISNILYFSWLSMNDENEK